MIAVRTSPVSALIIVWCAVVSLQTRGPIVSTHLGKIEGFLLKSRSGRLIYAFNSVPYAKPPVGDLRFAEPVKAHPWKHVWNGTVPSPHCVQFELIVPSQTKPIGQEDCLYLNIYTPSLDRDSNFPVMYYFHGGAWYMGGIRHHDPQYLLDHNIVLVEVAYRLGALGFLSMEDSTLPGNLGLKDQLFGLKWIRENIKNFGGDSDEVTLIGDSCGGSSAHLHMFSPLSRGLFKRSISISGTAHSGFAVFPAGAMKSKALQLSHSLGCNASNSADTLRCLRKKNAYDIISAQAAFFVWEIDPIAVLGPVVDTFSDNPFLPVDPHEATTPPIPWMTGVSSGDGLLRTARFTVNPNDYKTFNDHFNDLAPSMLLYNDFVVNPNEVSFQVRKHYFGNVEVTESTFRNLTDMYTDAVFLYPAITSIKKHEGPVYLYYFDYLGKSSYIDVLGSKRILDSATHIDEVIYLFNQTFFPPLNGHDVELSKRLVEFFTNFAIYGNPSPGISKRNFTWNKWENNGSYLKISKDGFSMHHNLLDQRYDFWSSLYEKNRIIGAV